MEIEKLIKMANQIGDFFEAYLDEEAAKKGIAAHLKRYWNSVMIKSMLAHVKDNQGSGLHPRVLDAVKEHIA